MGNYFLLFSSVGIMIWSRILAPFLLAPTWNGFPETAARTRTRTRLTFKNRNVLPRIFLPNFHFFRFFFILETFLAISFLEFVWRDAFGHWKDRVRPKFPKKSILVFRAQFQRPVPFPGLASPRNFWKSRWRTLKKVCLDRSLHR